MKNLISGFFFIEMKETDQAKSVYITILTPIISYIKCSHTQATLRRVNTTANYDIPEGLFDGLMQVMVCGVSILYV
jgi:hypothetical protein